MSAVADTRTKEQNYQKYFFEAFSALTPKKKCKVSELFRLAAASNDDQERIDNVMVAFKLLFGRPMVEVESLQASDLGNERLQKHRKHVAKNIKRLREQKGWTQVELAKAAGLHQTHVSRLETATHAATYRTIQRIADAMGVNPSQIDTSFE